MPHFKYLSTYIFLYRGSITLTYFSIEHGIFPVILSLSISHGIGFSLIYAQAIGSVIKWFIGNKKGLMSSIAIGGYGFGAAIWIPIETHLVNPNNIKAIGITDKYFEDPKILAKIPSLFLLLGGIFALMQMIGLLLLQEVPEKSQQFSG